ncbi:MAG: DUF4332 domain-containing protein [Anaerolineales bacterium]|nr:DUF4332 domain-containing protein [Anaerolineales bacterium]MCB0011935.1 DUF4332 domain-containing protein [Anaerolineales bacterium]MCB0016860.1 DUF4332 domain-containing protein [Anaerolineales bacterium]MCB0031511.1 DUF4332 domain-containing protein [Anaerolineales bacterium]MCB8962283.1 DUF4332 domain-containing protein [Ardenticatenales bacterium]
MTKLTMIEGIGSANAEKMFIAGIQTTEALLEAGGTKQGRVELAGRTGIAESVILSWVNMADLFRIKGISSQYAELLEAAGVDTVKELARRNPENLLQAMIEANNKRKMVRRVPAMAQVTGWVETAKSTNAMVSH